MTPHSLVDRRRAVLDVMAKAGVVRLICCGNGHHMIDLANPIAHLTGYRSVGPAVLVLHGDGRARLLTSPADEAEAIGALGLTDARAVDDLGASLVDVVDGSAAPTATMGLRAMPRRLAASVTNAIGADAKPLDVTVYAATARKTDNEIAAARRATEIAEAGYKYLLETVRPGVAECDLAVDVNFFMRGLGANDSFLMLNCGPCADAVMPSSERIIEAGDLLLCELSPSFAGQFTQICRTVSIGAPAATKPKGYAFLVEAMHEGIGKVRPGGTVGEVCAAIDDHLSAAGFAQYSRPPFIRRRGHGLGAGSVAPGDVAVDNATLLEPGMLFMVHPNQFLPDTGYMMCGEPVLVTEGGFDVLTKQRSALAVIDLVEGRRA
jgi:Xaa-Pro dipeptidase